MWAWIRKRSSPASHASSTSRASSSGVASAMAIRVGPWFEPFRNRRSPLTLAIHDRRRICRSPVRRCRASEGPPPSAASSATPTWRSWSTAAPSARGHHSSGRSIVIVHSRSLAPVARGWSVTCSTPAMVVWTDTDRAASLSRVARSSSTARSGVASRHSARSRAIRTGPVSVTRTGRQTPPGFQSGSRQSQCWKTPVRFRLAVSSAGASR